MKGGRSSSTERCGSDGERARRSRAADELKALVERFLLHLGDHEVDKVAADLAPKALS